MARKKRQPGGPDPKRRRPKPPLDKLPDRRALEGVMQQIVAGLQGHADPETPFG
jgi:hypothetical protein